MRVRAWKGQVCLLHLLLEGLITVLGALAFLKRDSHEAGCAEGAGTVLPSVSHTAEGEVRRCPGSQGNVGCGSHLSVLAGFLPWTRLHVPARLGLSRQVW